MSGERLQLRAERAPFVMLPRWLLYHQQVGEGAKFLYCVLHDLVNGREGPTRPVTRAKLAELSRVSANTIDRRLAELVAAGAVEKEPQILAGGQVANVYQVWLTPPEQRHHDIPTNGEPRSDRIPTNGEPVPNGHLPVDNRLPTDGEARSQRISMNGEPPHQWGTPFLTPGDASVLEEEEEDQEPPTPRTAGEFHDQSSEDRTDDAVVEFKASPHLQRSVDHRSAQSTIGRRADGTNLRAVGANPRAAASAAAADRDRERTARLEAAAEAKTAARLAAERAGEAAVVAFEAEALALSGALDDHQLAAIVDSVRDHLIGPLAQSTLPVTRAVVAWCRHAAADRPDSSSLGVAVTAALAAGRRLPDVPPPPLPLAAAPPGTVPLRRRVATLMGSRVEEAV